MFSLTTKNEYTNEFLQSIKDGKCSTPPSSNSIYPIGIRNIMIQEEHYGESKDHCYKLEPKIFSKFSLSILHYQLSIKSKNCCSSKISIVPISCAFFSLLPAFSPTTK